MNSNDKKVTFLGLGILFMMILVSVIFGSNASSSEEGGGGSNEAPFAEMNLMNGNEKSPGELDVGASDQKNVDMEGVLIRNITATVTWQDESSIPGRPRIRQYTNQPETFSLSISDSTGNFSMRSSGSNPVGGQGEVTVEISLTDEDLLQMMEMDNIVSSWVIEVTLDESGGWTPRFGMIGIADGSNAYSLDIDYEYYDILKMTEE